MEALVVYPENKEQLAALKAVMKAMKVSFKQKSEVLPDCVIYGIKESLRQVDQGLLNLIQG